VPAVTATFAVLAVLAMALAVAVVMTVNKANDRSTGTGLVSAGSGPGSPAPATSPASAATDGGREQALAVDALLQQTRASRAALGPALDQVNSCGDVVGAAQTIEKLTTDRDTQSQRAQSLEVGQLAGGPDAKAALTEALSYSLSADRSFLAWARYVRDNGCPGTPPSTTDLSAAQSASSGATKAKQRFVALWNPLASRYGLPSRVELDL